MNGATGTEAEAIAGGEGEMVREWRRQQLRAAGYAGIALALLTDSDADLHLARNLVEAGCPHETAARILL